MSVQDLEISIQEAQRVIAETPPDDYLLLDCRNRDEHAFVHIPNATLIPMDEITSREAELRAYQGRKIIVYCHMGVRSAMVTQWLRENEFPHAQSLAGGIDAWSVQVDPSLPRY